MSTLNDRDLDYVAAILDHCDRIDEIMERLNHSKEEYERDTVFQDAVKMKPGTVFGSLFSRRNNAIVQQY